MGQRKDTWPVWASPCLALSLRVCRPRQVGWTFSCGAPGSDPLWSCNSQAPSWDKEGLPTSGVCSAHLLLDSPEKPHIRNHSPHRGLRSLAQSPFPTACAFLPHPKTRFPNPLCSQARSCDTVLVKGMSEGLVWATSEGMEQRDGESMGS